MLPNIVSILLCCSKTDITIRGYQSETALELAKEQKGRYPDREKYDEIIKLIQSRAAGETLPGGATCPGNILPSNI